MRPARGPLPADRTPPPPMRPPSPALFGRLLGRLRQLDGLRPRLVLLVMAALVPPLLMLAWQYQQEAAGRLAQIESRLADVTQQAVREQQSLVNEARLLLSALGRLPALRAVLPPAEPASGPALDPAGEAERVLCARTLREAAAGVPWARGLAVADRQGHRLCATRQESEATDLSRRPYFRQVLESGGFVLSDVLVGHVVREPQLVAAAPMLDGAGQITGVVMAVIDLGWVGRLAGRYLESVDLVFVMDSQGQLVARQPEMPSLMGRSFFGHPLHQAMLHQGRGSWHGPGLDGVRRVVAFAPLPGTGAHVLVARDEATVLAPLHERQWISLALVAAAGLLAAVLAWWAGRALLLRGIEAMVGAAQTGQPWAAAAEDAWVAPEIAQLQQALAAGERRRAEAVALTDAMFHHAVDGLFLIKLGTDHGVCLERWNPSAGAMLMLPQAASGGQPQAAFLPDALAAVLAEDCRTCLALGTVFEAVETAALLSEQGIQREVTLVPLREADGSVQRLYGTARDITHLKVAELQARLAAERMEVVLRGADLGTWEWHVPTDALEVDGRWAGILGREREEIAPSLEGWTALIHGDDLQATWGAVQDHLDGSNDFLSVEHRLAHADGSWVWVLVRGRVVERDADGRPLLVSGTMADVTTRKLADQRLAESEAGSRRQADLLAAVMTGMAQGLAAFDADGRLITANERYRQMMDIPAALVARGTHHRDIGRFVALRGEYGPGDPEEQAETRFRAAASRNPNHTFSRVRPNGMVLEVTGRPLPHGGFVNTYTDATERVARENALRESEERFRLLAENSGDVVALADADTTRRYVSPAAERVLGWKPEQLVGTRPRDFVHPEDAGWVEAAMQRLFGGSTEVSVSYRFRRPDGSYRWIDVHASARHDAEGRLVDYVAVMRDGTERKEAERQLRAAYERMEQIASTDGLTGLANRRSFDEMLEREWRRAARDGAPLSLLLLDADNFKKFNDRYGHVAGDECLRQVAAALGEVARRSGDLPARHGGEEFALLMPGTDELGALHVAERVRAQVQAIGMAHEGNPPGIVTVSLGVATLRPRPDSSDPSIDTLISSADGALYAAKAEGRNRVASAFTLPVDFSQMGVNLAAD